MLCVCSIIQEYIFLISYPWHEYVTEQDGKNTMLYLIKVESYTIELTVHKSYYCVLDLLCVTKSNRFKPFYENNLPLLNHTCFTKIKIS